MTENLKTALLHCELKQEGSGGCYAGGAAFASETFVTKSLARASLLHVIIVNFGVGSSKVSIPSFDMCRALTCSMPTSRAGDA